MDKHDNCNSLSAVRGLGIMGVGGPRGSPVPGDTTVCNRNATRQQSVRCHQMANSDITNRPPSPASVGGLRLLRSMREVVAYPLDIHTREGHTQTEQDRTQGTARDQILYGEYLAMVGSATSAESSKAEVGNVQGCGTLLPEDKVWR